MSLAGTLTEYTEQVEALGVLFENSVGGAPTPEIAAGYNADLDAFEFVADVDQLTVPMYPNGGLPQLTVIDTGTMQIVYKGVLYDEAAVLAAATGI